ncbi:hypothetical protein DPMN_016019 [Dreissena polymorpha]|uniref:Uncharacterized protein n=1 Tax=Dreissena polymorpha TaxID=45954 RepID=A0A9D4NDR4_DREPO|nr:hypothetical protein DPMN_016019 [Dreissena polymorpha]
MSEDPDGSTLSLGTSKESTDWKLCTICQEKKNNKGTVVLNPRTESYQKLLDIVADRASVQDGEYVTLQRRLQDCTKQTMLEAKSMWHRSCYSCATNEICLQRARERFEHSMSTGSYSVKKRGHKRTNSEMEANTPTTSTTFTRSATAPLSKDRCFFCQVDDGQSLFTVRTENAGNELKNAMQITQDPVLMTRLNNAVAPTDAHAIDVRYHKLCWTNHVFRVLRDDARNQARPTTADLPMQMACLIELINIVDIETQNKAYLPMDVIESTYISMLGGSDEAEKHTPTLIRQWLKDKVLSELPSVTSVRQKNRQKPSVLYCPEACEGDMVNTSMMKDNASEIDNTKMLYKKANLIRTRITDSTESDRYSHSNKHKKDVPNDFYSLIRWILVGPAEELQTEMRSRTVDRSALTISQNIMYAFKTRRQVQHKPKHALATFRTQSV